MAETTVSISFIRMPEQTIEQVELPVPTGARGYQQRVTDACAGWARAQGFTHWAQPYTYAEVPGRQTERWLVFGRTAPGRPPAYMVHQPTREAAEMWVVHRGV